MSDSAQPAGDPSADENSPRTDNPTPPPDVPTPAVPDKTPQKPRKAPPKRKGPSVVVRYGLMRQIGEFTHNLETPPPVGSLVVVRTERGVELGKVVTPIVRGDEACGISAECMHRFIRNNGSDYPFYRGGRVMRIANQQDQIDHRHLSNSSREEATYCRDQIRQMKLDMKLVSVEHLLGGGRIVFYFIAENRVDFRELVRQLAGQYRTRIEMRQVGSRDEARLMADYERCGRRCCCQQFLKDLKPISMRMAKTQKATLDPTKISGRCGRLMCCLRYEDAGYEELRKKLPRRNTWIRTGSEFGRVVSTQTLTQLVRIAVRDGTQKIVSNDDIAERDVTPPKEGETPPDNGKETQPSSPKPKTAGKGARGSAGDRPADKPEAKAPLPPAEAKGPAKEKDAKTSADKKPRRRRGKRRGRGSRGGEKSGAQNKRGGKSGGGNGGSGSK